MTWHASAPATTGESGRAAKTICAACPVRPQCLQYALDHDERYGIWGGMSERERHKLKTRQRKGTHL